MGLSTDSLESATLRGLYNRGPEQAKIPLPSLSHALRHDETKASSRELHNVS